MTDDIDPIYDHLDKLANNIAAACNASPSLANKYIIATLPNHVNQQDYNKSLDTLKKMATDNPKYQNLCTNLQKTMETMRKLHNDPKAITYTELHMAERVTLGKNKGNSGFSR